MLCFTRSEWLPWLNSRISQEELDHRMALWKYFAARFEIPCLLPYKQGLTTFFFNEDLSEWESKYWMMLSGYFLQGAQIPVKSVVVLHGYIWGSNTFQSTDLTKRTAAAAGRGVLNQMISVVAANMWGLQTCQKWCSWLQVGLKLRQAWRCVWCQEKFMVGGRPYRWL